MEKLEIVIAVLLLCLAAVALYAATSWTLSKRKKRDVEADHEKELRYKYLEDEAEHARKKAATAYAQETMPRITITPVQPRPVFPRSLMSSDEKVSSDEEEEESQSDDHQDLGRLYFALRYDQQRSMLIVRLIRAEDIPVEGQSMSTYVDVHLLPLNLQSQTFEPHDTTINVTFRELYEFPLSQSDMALQTLNLHICRYDNYSRRSSVGDVFLALAELSAQGIDFTREVFLCRNIISHQEVYRTVGKRKRRQPVDDQDDFAEKKQQREKPKRDRRVAKKVSSQKMWDVLRRAVQSGSYKGAYLSSDSAMHWESIFSPGVSSTEGCNLASATSSPIKSSEFFFSGPGPPDSPDLDTGEGCGASWTGGQDTEFDFPPIHTDESEFESSLNEQENDEGHRERSPVKHVQLSPAPEEYYRIVPITPFTPYKGKKETTEPSCSWKLPQTFTSRDHEVVETLSHAYKEPRVVSLDSRPRHEIASCEEAPPAKKSLFVLSAAKRRRKTKQNNPEQKMASRLKKPERKSRGTVSSKHSRKMSPRKEPEGEPAEKMAMANSARGRAKHSSAKFRVKASLRGHKVVSWQKESTEDLSITERPTSEVPEEESTMDRPALTENTRPIQYFPTVSSTAEYVASPMCTLKDFYSITRSQSDPSVDVERLRCIGESPSEIRRTHSMLELRDEELAWEETP